MSRNQVGEESCAMYEPVSQVEKKETSVAFLHPWRGLVPPVAGLGGAWFRPVTALAQILTYLSSVIMARRWALTRETMRR